jgi:hypothetical protein
MRLLAIALGMLVGIGSASAATPTPVYPANPSTGLPTAAPLVPVVSSALEASHVLKAAPGTLYSAYASNLTGGSSGNLLILNATSAPADGVVAPLVCVPFSGGVASANYANIPPASFDTGIVAVVSSATSCFTKTTGALTAFISGIVQ